jgi:hypothetical protein
VFLSSTLLYPESARTAISLRLSAACFALARPA